MSATSCHFFASMFPSQVDDPTVDDYKRHKQREQTRIEAAIVTGRRPPLYSPCMRELGR